MCRPCLIDNSGESACPQHIYVVVVKSPVLRALVPLDGKAALLLVELAVLVRVQVALVCAGFSY